MMEDVKLKPTIALNECPFCKAESEWTSVGNTAGEVTFYIPACSECEAVGPYSLDKSPEKLARLWNTRANPSPPSESAVDALAGMLEAIFKSNPDNSFAQRELALISQQMLRLRGYHLTPIAAPAMKAMTEATEKFKAAATYIEEMKTSVGFGKLVMAGWFANHWPNVAAYVAELEHYAAQTDMAERVRVLESAVRKARNVTDILAHIPVSDWETKPKLQSIFKQLDTDLVQALAGGKEGA